MITIKIVGYVGINFASYCFGYKQWRLKMKNYIYLILMVMNLISCGRNEHVSQLKNSGTSQKLGFKLIKNVPYYLQGDNRYEPSNTCGLTSLAMIASYNSRIRYSSDYLYKKYRKRMGQDPLSSQNVKARGL